MCILETKQSTLDNFNQIKKSKYLVDHYKTWWKIGQAKEDRRTGTFFLQKYPRLFFKIIFKYEGKLIWNDFWRFLKALLCYRYYKIIALTIMKQINNYDHFTSLLNSNYESFSYSKTLAHDSCFWSRYL